MLLDPDNFICNDIYYNILGIMDWSLVFRLLKKQSTFAFNLCVIVTLPV